MGIVSKSDGPLFPAYLYIYNNQGRYGVPVVINSEEQLNSPEIELMLKDAMARKVEILLTDLADLTLFHAQNGKILFDGERLIT